MSIQSRVEEILGNILGDVDTLPTPQSRVERLLILLKDAIETGGGTIDTQMNPTSSNAVENRAIVAFVNSSIATSTADFKGTYTSVSALDNIEADANDYAFVIDTDVAGNTIFKRYKYTDDNGWLYEYSLNNSSFTAAQWATINSLITAADKAQIAANTAAIANKLNISDVDNALSITSENPVQNKVITAVIGDINSVLEEVL